MALDPFHLAIAVDDVDRARTFYTGLLGCREGRSSKDWIDFDFFGHQLVCHKNVYRNDVRFNPVDGEQVPVPHFGIVLEMPAWQTLKERLHAHGTRFIIEPCIRFQGRPGEQATMFLYDPFGNALEFKAFKNRDRELFARQSIPSD